MDQACDNGSFRFCETGCPTIFHAHNHGKNFRRNKGWHLGGRPSTDQGGGQFKIIRLTVRGSTGFGFGHRIEVSWLPKMISFIIMVLRCRD